MQYRQTFEVAGGRGSQFPLDMLRYDQCYPDTEHDSARIEYTLDASHPIRLRRTVDNKKRMPTEARWKSFGWKVVPGSVKTERC